MAKKLNRQINSLLIASSLFITLSCKNPKSELKHTNQIELNKDGIINVIETEHEILLDTVTEISTPMHYEIKRTNYLRDSIITKTSVNMKDFLHIEFKLDSLIPVILTKNKNAINIGFNNITKKKIYVVKNDYSFIRANNIYFDVSFIFNERKHKIKYAITYSGKQKGKFWHFAGLMKSQR